MSETAPDYLEMPLGRFLELVASEEPAPAGGSVAAVAVALAAGLAGKSARLSRDHLPDAPELAKRSETLMKVVAPLAREDAAAYAEVLAARRDGRDVRKALSGAADAPLAIAETGAEVAEVATRLAARGNPNLKGDAACALLLAGAATRAAARLAGIDLSAAGIEDERTGRARELTEAAASALRILGSDGRTR